MERIRKTRRITSRINSVNVHRHASRHTLIKDNKDAYEKIYNKESEDISGAIATMKSVSKRKKELAYAK